MVSDERYVEILSGVEKVKQEKPYGDPADAVAALDWLTSAGADLRKAINQADGDVAEIARLQRIAETVDGLQTSVAARIERDGEQLPIRHSGKSDAEVII